MADYSQYGVMADDWAEWMKENPEKPIGNLTTLQIRDAMNAGREAAAAEVIKNIRV